MNQVHVNQEARETLSAGVDGELAAPEWRFLLRRIDHDEELQRVWSRYHLMREGLRGRMPALASAGFAERVEAAIAREAAPAGVRRRHWLRWSAGGAIAASVAVVTLMVGHPSNDTEPVIAAQSASQDAGVPVENTYASRVTTMPSAVPPWLSGGAAGALSQPASVTLGAPFTEVSARPAMSSSGYALPLFRQRKLDNGNGSYLLLIDTARSAGPHDAAVAQ
ncbi:MAG: anti-anti-sigma factor [Xanthomonadales bacterium]|nr:anti-anti-sigma factor [Xanthomonadales bacterium]